MPKISKLSHPNLIVENCSPQGENFLDKVLHLGISVSVTYRMPCVTDPVLLSMSIRPLCIFFGLWL